MVNRLLAPSVAHAMLRVAPAQIENIVAVHIARAYTKKLSGSLGLATTWFLDRSGWARERDTGSLRKQHWPIPFRYRWVHHGIVPEPSHMGVKTVFALAPIDGAYLVAPSKGPLSKAMKKFCESFGIYMLVKAHKSVSHSHLAAEINWQVKKIVTATEAFGIDEGQKHVPCILVRNIPHDDSTSPAESVMKICFCGAGNRCGYETHT